DGGEGETGGVEDGAEVLHDAARLGGDVAVHELTRRRIEWDLPRQEKQLTRANRLGVRADRLWGVGTDDGFSHGRRYAALVTLPDRRHRVQTRMRFTPPPTTALTVWRFGSNRRALTLCAWLI